MIPGIISTVGSIIDKIIPDPKAAAEAKFKLLELQQSGELKLKEMDLNASNQQIEVNKIEAQSDNLFKSGWRPWIGWVCGMSLTYDYIFRPLFSGFLAKFGFPLMDLNTTELYPLLLGLLGLGALRTIEKVKNSN